MWYLDGANIQKKNSNILKKAENRFPSIKYLFPILNEHAKPNPIVQENLYTNGGELYYDNGDEYIGAYHIHPQTGPMVGASHISSPHDSLFYFQQLPQIPGYSYQDFIKNYDKIECYKCVKVNDPKIYYKEFLDIKTINSSKTIGCPEGSFETYELANDACPELNGTSTTTPNRGESLGGGGGY